MPLSNNEEFIFGINLPWFQGLYGHDLGPSQHMPVAVPWYEEHRDEVSQNFSDIAAIGFSHVRVWLMEGAEGWVVDPRTNLLTELHEVFLTNLEDLVERAKAEGVKLYLCFNDKWMQLIGGERQPIPYPSPYRDPAQADAYLRHAVQPLTRLLSGKEAVFAFDITNEIESEVSEEAGDNQISVDQAKQFVRRNVEAVKAAAPERLVSCGSGWHGYEPLRQGHYSGLGLDFYDAHIYQDDGEVLSAESLSLDRPIILGEFGQGATVEDDTLQKNADVAFVRNAFNSGYAGCFVWAYGPKEEFHSLHYPNGERRPVVEALESTIRELRSGAD
jgi:hypothetical protein